MSDGLFDGVLARGGVREATSDRAWLQAMLDVEAALARARARAGQIPAARRRRDRRGLPGGGLRRRRARRARRPASGNPAAPLARALTARVAGAAAAARCTAAPRARTSSTRRRCWSRATRWRSCSPTSARPRTPRAALARAHRDTPMAGRTLLQQAVPTTFGLKAAGWALALDDAAARLSAVRERAARRAARRRRGHAGLARRARRSTVLARFAAELGLAEPVLPWHTARGRIAELAGALGGACGGGRQDRRRRRAARPDRGRRGARGARAAARRRCRTSATRSPRSSALGCARQAPGLVAAAARRAGEHEHERAAGSWHAEWAPLRALLVATGSAAAWLRECLEGLEVDPARMRENLDRTGGLLLAERVATALADVARPRARQRAGRRGRASGRPFAEALAATGHLEPAELERLLDPAEATGSAAALVDRAFLRARALSGYPCRPARATRRRRRASRRPRARTSAPSSSAPRPGTSSSPATFARMRTLPPTGSGAGKRTLLRP